MREGRIVQYDTPFNILTRSADDFVHQLVGADDMVRQLGLVRVQTAMQMLPPDHEDDGHPTIGCDDSLREALSLLLRTNAPRVTVLDEDAPVGILTLDDIRASTENGEARELHP